MSAPEAAWRDRVAAARRRGDHLAAFDCACEGLVALPGSLPLHYAAILALARSGATRGARARLEALQASGALDRIDDPGLALDFAALDGRLHKDAWARSEGEAARHHARRSGDAYAAAFARFDRSYPAVNAATLFLAAGDGDRAHRYARAALACAMREPAGYWTDATLAEAALVLGDTDAAAAALDCAAARRPGLDDAAATRRQIRSLARATGADPGIVDRLPVPAVGYWLDDGAAAPSPAGADGTASAAGIVFGTLAEPADVVRAAWFIARGAEVTLVLPCEPAAWLAALDAAAASSVGARFARVVEEAAATVVVTREGRPDDPAALHLCRRQVRGLARLRAAGLAAAAHRIAWPGDPAADPVLRPDPAADGAVFPALDPDGREPRAIVFGDVRGFSRLGEADQLLFLEQVIGGFAAALAAEAPVHYAETAGDGIYIVLPDVETAARCCLGLRDVLDPVRIAAAGLPPHLGLRLSAHVGPVYRRFDRVAGRLKYCGTEVIRTARIEPVTPVGEIYVTEQFAAVLADAAGDRYSCDYAGLQPMAKGYGSCRMYALRPARG